MGLFDQLSTMLSGAAGTSSSAGASDSNATDQLMSVLDQHGISGVSGIVQQFQQSGLAAHAASWLGNGDNLPINADQVRQALGNPVITSIAQRFGIDTSQAAQLLAQHLPAAVDQATPDGTTPDA